MRLERLCWEPRGGFYIAMTDAGAFRVPNVRGGWHQRTRWPYSIICHPAPAGAAEALGIVPAASAAPRLGGCNCMGHRR